MERESRLIHALKRVLYRPEAKHIRLQRFWGLLNTLATYGMNYGGGGSVDTSGEEWVLANIVRCNLNGAVRPVIFDVGANVGDYSLLAALHFPQATIHAFEPEPDVCARLKARSEKSGADIRVHNIALSNVASTVQLHSYAIAGERISLLSSLVPRLPTQVLDCELIATEHVPAQTIDGFCERNRIDVIDLLKLDVEGHELSVLRGARRMLSEGTIKMVQFEFGPGNIYSRTFFFDFWSLLSHRYDLFRIIPEGIVSIPEYGEHREVFLNTNYFGVLRELRA